MARRRRNPRMFSREERKRARVEQLRRVSLLTPAERDAELLARVLGSAPASALQAGEAWLGLFELGELRTALEEQLIAALEREFERLYGAPVTVDVVEDLREGELERDEAEREARYWTTDAGFEERILDAEIAAQEPREEGVSGG